MDRNGYWVKRSLSTGEVISLIRVENDLEDSYWDFELGEFVRLAKPIAELGMSDDYDDISEDEVLEILGKTSWEE